MSKIIIAEPDVTPMDRELGRRCLEVLHEHYPEWQWVVEIPPGQNVVVVRNLDCDPYGRMGMVSHKDRLYGDQKLHKVIMGAGEFLERYRMKAAGFDKKQMEGRIMLLERPET